MRGARYQTGRVTKDDILTWIGTTMDAHQGSVLLEALFELVRAPFASAYLHGICVVRAGALAIVCKFVFVPCVFVRAPAPGPVVVRVNARPARVAPCVRRWRRTALANGAPRSSWCSWRGFAC